MKKILFDLFPIFLFFIAFKLAGSNPEQAAALAASVSYPADPKQLPILMATAVAIIATVVQIAWVWLRHGKVDTMLWISLALVVVLGGATLWLHDPTFIKWKPTVLYWLFAVVLAGSHLLFKKNLIRTMMQQAQMELPETLWAKLNYSWVIFFAVMGVVNLYIANNFSLAAWVNFKLFGFLGMMLAFMLLQGLVLAKYIEKETD
jgi:intracellular septation protein